MFSVVFREILDDLLHKTDQVFLSDRVFVNKILISLSQFLEFHGDISGEMLEVPMSPRNEVLLGTLHEEDKTQLGSLVSHGH